MSKLLSLIKIQLNAQFGFSYAIYTFKNDRKALWKGIGIGLAILLALGEVIGLYTLMMVQLYRGAMAVNTPQIVLTLAAVVSGLIVLMFGIFYILSSLFLARDTEFLASLPIPQGSVFVSKFMLVLIGEYPLAFFLMLPPLIIYGIGTQKGILYYLLGLFCILLVPLVPLIVSAILSLLLMNIVSRSRRRDLITIIGSIVLMVLFIGGQNYLFSRMPENKQDFILALLQSSNAFVEYMGRAFPPAVWITKVLSAGGTESLINLIYLVLTSIGAFIIVYLMASFIYRRGAAAQVEAFTKQGKTKLYYGASSRLSAIFKNEWRILLRTPVYVLNSLVVVFMAPLLMMIPMFGGNFAADPDLKFLYDLTQKGDSQPGLLLILSGIITALALINPAVSSTFSREGKHFWILKNIPVKPEIQVFGKLLAGYSISFAAAFLAAVMTMLSFGISFWLTLMIIVLSSLALIPISIFGILIDMLRPKLSWNNPQEAIKQNANVVFAMLAGFVLISIFGLAGYLITILDVNAFTLFGIMTAILIAVSLISLRLLLNISKRAYQRIEA